jgi:hypothetical protein
LKSKDAKKSADKGDLQSLIAGHFLSLTIYALLEPPKQDADKKRNSKTLDAKKTNLVKDQEEPKAKTGFLEKTFSSFKSTKSEAFAQKSILDKRRTVGSATWNFDTKLFQNDLKNGMVGTPDIWRPINAITSGLNAASTRVCNVFFCYCGLYVYQSTKIYIFSRFYQGVNFTVVRSAATQTMPRSCSIKILLLETIFLPSQKFITFSNFVDKSLHK